METSNTVKRWRFYSSAFPAVAVQRLGDWGDPIHWDLPTATGGYVAYRTPLDALLAESGDGGDLLAEVELAEACETKTHIRARRLRVVRVVDARPGLEEFAAWCGPSAEGGYSWWRAQDAAEGVLLQANHRTREAVRDTLNKVLRRKIGC